MESILSLMPFSIASGVEAGAYVSSRSDFKDSARMYLEQADALVTIGSPVRNHPWPGIDIGLLSAKPAFHLAHPDETSDELVGFVREKLGLGDAASSIPRRNAHLPGSF